MVSLRCYVGGPRVKGVKVLLWNGHHWVDDKMPNKTLKCFSMETRVWNSYRVKGQSPVVCLLTTGTQGGVKVQANRVYRGQSLLHCRWTQTLWLKPYLWAQESRLSRLWKHTHITSPLFCFLKSNINKATWTSHKSGRSVGLSGWFRIRLLYNLPYGELKKGPVFQLGLWHLNTHTHQATGRLGCSLRGKAEEKPPPETSTHTGGTVRGGLVCLGGGKNIRWPCPYVVMWPRLKGQAGDTLN